MKQVQSFFVRGFRIIRNLMLDLKYGQILGSSFITSRKSTNSDYLVLSKIFESQVGENDVLVDLGCGYGRVINWWLSNYPKHKMIGIEWEQTIADRTKVRLSKYKNVTIVRGDVIKNIPQEGTLFYFYNPFEKNVVEELKNRILEKKRGSKTMKLLYYNCKHISVFENDPNWQVEILKMQGHHSAPFNDLAIIKLA